MKATTRNITVTTFITIFIILLPISFFGFDVTDQGFHLTNQMLAYSLGFHYIIANSMSLCWLSDLLAGMWLHLTFPLGLWGARLGGVLVFSISGSVAVYTISQVYKPSWLMVFGILASLFYLINPDLTNIGVPILDYYSVPTLFGLIFGLFFIKTILKPRSIGYPVLTAIFMLLLCLSKITAISVVVVPIFTVLVACWFRIEDCKLYLRSISILYFLFFIGLVVYFLVLWEWGWVFTYLKTLFFHDSSHSFGAIIQKNWDVFYQQLPFILAVFLIPIFTWLFLQKRSKKLAIYVSSFFFVGIFICIFFLRFLFVYYWLVAHHFSVATVLNLRILQIYYFVFFVFLILLIQACMAFVFLYIKRKEMVEFSNVALLCIAISFAFVIGMGSNSGPAILFIGFWYLGILVPVLINQCRKFIPHITVFNILFLFCIGAVGITGFFTSHFFRDAILWKLNTPLSTTRVKNIYTTSGRAKSFDALVSEVQKNIQPDDFIFAYGDVPMVYFATQARPLYNNPWIIETVPYGLISHLSKTLCIVNHPRLIVRSLADTKNASWGGNRLPTVRGNRLERKLQIDKVVRQNCNPKLVWTNMDFQISIPQK